MQKTFVMTVIGKDRTGLVESLARLIADSGGNWLESRMCRLGGDFAGILRATVPEEKEQSLISALQEMQSPELNLIIRRDETTSPIGQTQMATLNMVGQDRPGILYQISSALARQNINFEELETEFSSAPMSGEMIFRATARLQLPQTCAVSELKKELEELGSELMVDISFSAL